MINKILQVLNKARTEGAKNEYVALNENYEVGIYTNYNNARYYNNNADYMITIIKNDVMLDDDVLYNDESLTDVLNNFIESYGIILCI